MAFNSSNISDVTISTYSDSYTNLTEEILLDFEKNYTILRSNSVEECIDSVKLTNSQICIVFPNDLSSEGSEEDVVFHIDYSRINLAYNLLHEIEGKIDREASDLGAVLVQNLIDSLNKAIITENRRIKKEIVNKNALRETGISLPKRKYNIKNKLKQIHGKVIAHFEANKSHRKVSYTKVIGEDKEERALSFYPVLQLENNGEFWLEQEAHFEEIHIWLKKVFLKHNPNPYEDLLTGEWNAEHLGRGEIVTDENEVLGNT